MSWVEIKKAVNSSLGTANFEPLDKKIERLFTNEYHVIGSSDIYYQFHHADEYVDLLEETTYTLDFPETFTATRNGYLYLSGSIAYSSEYNGHIYLIVRENENVVKELDLGTTAGTLNFSEKRIDIKASNLYSFAIKVTKGVNRRGILYVNGSTDWELTGKAIPSAIVIN